MKGLRLFIAFIIMGILTGCTIEVEHEIEIDDNNSGEITYTMMFDETTYDLVATEIEASIDELEETEEDVEVEIIEEDGKKGIRVKMSFEDLDKLKELIESDGVVVEYTINDDESVSFDIHYLKSVDEDDEMSVKYFYDVTITVPKIIEENAEDVKGKTMHWDFDSETDNIVSFTYAKEPVAIKILKVAGYVLLGAGIGFGGYFGYNKFLKERLTKKVEVELPEEEI